MPTAEDRDTRRQGTDDEALITTARRRFLLSEEGEAEIRREFLVDQQFRAGGREQWPTSVYQSRELDQRPAHSVNLIPGAIAQITNEQRRNRPSLRVSPSGGAATTEVAAVYDGLLRFIQRDSRAEIAYDMASAEAVGPGRGWFRLITDYESPYSFAQKLRIVSIPNAMSVYPQPNLREADYSDMNWCFLIEEMARDDFLDRFPDVEPQAFDSWASSGDPWVSRDTVRVADYYYRVYEETHLALLSDGTVVNLGMASRRALTPSLPQGLSISDTRVAQVPRVHWCKINGRQVLERTEWLGSWIPVFPVLGDVTYVNGVQRISGIIRDARDPQTMVNYWESARTEAIALAPRAPYIMAEGQDEGFEQEWDHANTRNLSVLHYKMQDMRGNVAPAPQRNVQEPAIQALNYACESAKNNFQATTRIFDASYGAPSNERSGRAIQVRDANADMSNSHYNANLGRCLHHLGRCLLELAPLIYREPGRVQQIIKEDDTEQLVTLNQRYRDKESGLERFYNLADGTYAVEIQLGPSFATRRQEAYTGLTELAKTDPKIMQVADDLVIAQSDIAGAKEIAARLKKTIPPDLLDTEQGQDKDAQLAQLQGALRQAQQEAQAINAHAQQVEQQLQQLAQDHAQMQQDQTTKGMDLELKRDEVQIKAAEGRAKLDLEQQKLLLEQQKIDLEVQKMVAEQQALANDAQAQQATTDATVSTLELVGTLQEQLATLSARLEAGIGCLLDDAVQRHRPRQMTMARDADGHLVGTVTDDDGQVVRRATLMRTDDGYEGEVQ